jgi:hypothetical protein
VIGCLFILIAFVDLGVIQLPVLQVFQHGFSINLWSATLVGDGIRKYLSQAHAAMLSKKISVDMLKILKVSLADSLCKQVVLALIFDSFRVTVYSSNELIKGHFIFANQSEQHSSVKALLQESLESIVSMIYDLSLVVLSQF